jgi:hypothetical protein
LTCVVRKFLASQVRILPLILISLFAPLKWWLASFRVAAFGGTHRVTPFFFFFLFERTLILPTQTQCNDVSDMYGKPFVGGVVALLCELGWTLHHRNSDTSHISMYSDYVHFPFRLQCTLLVEGRLVWTKFLKWVRNSADQAQEMTAADLTILIALLYYGAGVEGITSYLFIDGPDNDISD